MSLCVVWCVDMAVCTSIYVNVLFVYKCESV